MQPANPDILLVLLVTGALGIYMEFLRPGTILPGACGSILMLYGYAGFSAIEWRGLPIFLSAFLLFVLEVHYPAGYLLAAGAVLMPLGAIIMEPRIHPATALAVLIPFALITNFLLSTAVRARRNKRLFRARYPVKE